MGKELQQFFCKQCTWSGQEFFDPQEGFMCPSCGNTIVYGTERNRPKYPYGNVPFEHTNDNGSPGIFLLNDGRWQFVCECGHGEIWSTKQLAMDNYTTHQKLHSLVDAIKIRQINEIFDEIEKGK